MKYPLQFERLRARAVVPRQWAPRRAGRVVEAVVLASLAAYFFLGACGVFVP